MRVLLKYPSGNEVEVTLPGGIDEAESVLTFGGESFALDDSGKKTKLSDVVKAHKEKKVQEEGWLRSGPEA